jgi:hypothetical protein
MKQTKVDGLFLDIPSGVGVGRSVEGVAANDEGTVNE